MIVYMHVPYSYLRFIDVSYTAPVSISAFCEIFALPQTMCKGVLSWITRVAHSRRLLPFVNYFKDKQITVGPLDLGFLGVKIHAKTIFKIPKRKQLGKKKITLEQTSPDRDRKYNVHSVYRTEDYPLPGVDCDKAICLM